MSDLDPRPGARPLANIDLNLLLTLDAVVQHQSVTRAAEHLGVSQPAVSAALGRLRRHFDDQILQRVGNRYRLTPFGADLRRRTRLALTGVERVFDARGTFDSTDTTREFTVITSDYTVALLGGRLTELLTEHAPHARLRWIPSNPELVTRAEHTLTVHDVLLVPHGFITDLPSEIIFHDDWMVITDETRSPGALTSHDLRERPWVLVFHSQTASTPAARQLRMLGIEPTAQVITENFLTTPHLVRGSERIALVPRRLLELPGMLDGLRMHPCPVELSRLGQAMWWHPIFTDEPEHRFLRTLVHRAAVELSHRGTGGAG
ncbi:LysR family transcriptional regulator [Nocardia beijingensis]